MRRRLLRLAVVGVVCGLGLTAAGAAWIWHSFNRAGPLVAETDVIIPAGTPLRRLTGLLAEREIIREPNVFLVGVYVQGNAHRLRAGEYMFPPGASMAEVARRLVAGRSIQHRLTVPEGLTSFEVVALVDQAHRLSGTAPANSESRAFLPDTYFYSRGDTRDSILERMAAAMQVALRESWRGRNENLAIQTPEEALVLASIIEKESGLPSERARISAVFHNRLRRGMRLQADPTVVFALTGGRGGLGRSLTRQDLMVNSPYNTYRNKGLPPGPIGNPGRASLEAAVKPLETQELYFVADGEGGHRFARTLREHNRNVREWRRRRGSGPAQ